MKRWTLLLIVCLILIGTFALPALGSTQEAIEIQQMLISPSSLDLGITVYNNPDSTSQTIKDEIDKKIAAGETKDQIINDFVAQYGPSILAAPPKKGLGLVAWVIPPVFIIAGVFVMYYVIKRNRKHNVDSEVEVDNTKIDPDLDKEILRYI